MVDTDWIIKAVIEINLRHNNKNREDGLVLIGLWKPQIHPMKEQGKPPHQGTQHQKSGPLQYQWIQALLPPYLLQLAVTCQSVQFFIS